jgi:hypothetical protein
MAFGEAEQSQDLLEGGANTVQQHQRLSMPLLDISSRSTKLTCQRSKRPACKWIHGRYSATFRVIPIALRTSCGAARPMSREQKSSSKYHLPQMPLCSRFAQARTQVARPRENLAATY